MEMEMEREQNRVEKRKRSSELGLGRRNTVWIRRQQHSIPCRTDIDLKESRAGPGTSA